MAKSMTNKDGMSGSKKPSPNFAVKNATSVADLAKMGYKLVMLPGSVASKALSGKKKK